MSQETEGSAQARPSAWAIAFGAGSEFVAYALVGVVAGTWLDKKFGFATPWCALVGSVGAITFGLYRFVRAFVRPQNGPPGRR
jgi:F0F1-type ATP synthase assembly protein I